MSELSLAQEVFRYLVSGSIPEMKVDYTKLCPWHLFHHLWTCAVGTENYDKKAWREMDKFIKRPEVCDCAAAYTKSKNSESAS